MSTRGYVWRIVVAALLSLSLLVTAAAADTPRPRLLLLLDPAAGLVSWVLVFWRRRWPTAVAIVIGAMASLSIVSVGPAAWALFSLATTRRWTRYLITAGVMIAATVGYEGVQDPSFFRDWPFNLFELITFAGGIALVAAWGGQVGARRELLWTLRDRAERAEAERDLRAAQARSRERERIAREMHDVLAHRISQISMHAGALAYRSDLAGEQLAESVQTIRQSAHQALAELRDLLGVLRTDRSGTDAVARESEARLPVPTAGALPELISTNRTAGMTITAEIDETVTTELPDRIGRTVYRVVQEGLTNAARHAPGAAVHVTVYEQHRGQIELSVRNDLVPAVPPESSTQVPESGFGLTGLQERVDMLGGTLEATPDAGGYLLRAQLPWTSERVSDPDPDRR